MTLYHCWKWLVTIYIIQILFFLYCSGLAVTSTPDPFHKDIKNDDIVKPKNSTTTSKGGNEGGSTPLSMAMESVLTFISVFVVGCVITLSVYSWKKFKPTSWRMPVPYQYSVLSQFENDPDDESVDPEHCLNMMAEDTSSEDDEINVTTETTGKTIGAIDLNEPPNANEPATLPISVSEISKLPKKTILKSGKKRNSSSNLLQDSDGSKSSRHSSIGDDVFLTNGNGVSLEHDLMTR